MGEGRVGCSEKVYDDFGVGFHPCLWVGRVERAGIPPAEREGRWHWIRRSITAKSTVNRIEGPRRSIAHAGIVGAVRGANQTGPYKSNVQNRKASHEWEQWAKTL